MRDEGVREMRETTKNDPIVWMTTAQLSDYLEVPGDTLKGWRRAGTGPRFCRLNARVIRYLKSDVLAWIDASAVGKMAFSESVEQP